MTEIEKNKEAESKTEDWAIIPFDEAEDDARWSKLIEETDKLIEETRELEAVHGKILMENETLHLTFDIINYPKNVPLYFELRYKSSHDSYKI
ncbi:MAG: hypothetical protein HC846_13990 [Blastocatellia bacterium]|nr:hypothetical protein [Blastocatellia bacterium]